MKLKGITLVSGFALTAVGSVAIWQALVVALLVHGIDEVIGAFGRLL
jgi:hypothetical protein